MAMVPREILAMTVMAVLAVGKIVLAPIRSHVRQREAVMGGKEIG